VKRGIFGFAAVLTLSAGAVVTAAAADPTVSAPRAGDGPAVAAVEPEKYEIGPEDLLFVRVWREPDFTLPVTVRPDGKITMPLIGEVQAAGQSPLQLTAALKKLLLLYLNNPDVSVSVTEVRSKKFYIDGEVNRPGAFALVTPTSLLEALSRGGGFREFANTKKIRVLRGGEILHFNYNAVTNARHLEQNIAVEDGDHIIVP
jgi:polysaccharide export outer membrane protein